MSYPRACVKCGQTIIMSELSTGRWQPWETDGSSRHKCKPDQHVSLQVLSSLSYPSKFLDKSETYLTRCPWCRQHVHYHTNGNGDCVYFDSIGYPWQIHSCWEEYWKESKDRQRVLKKLFKRNNLDQQKLRILAGVLQSVSKVEHGNQEIYKTSEANLARFLGISVEGLKEEYGHLYVAETQGVKLCRFSNTNKAVKKDELPSIDVKSKFIQSELISCHRCGQAVWKRRLTEHLKSSHSLYTKVCEICKDEVSQDLFEQHFAKCQVKPKKTKLRAVSHIDYKHKIQKATRRK